MGEIEVWIAKYMEVVDKIISYIPYKRAGVWKEFFLNPAGTVRKNIDGIMPRMIDLYVIGGIGLIISIFSSLIPYAISLLITAPLAVIPAIGISAAIILFSFAITPLLTLLYALFEFVVAKILGGKADFTVHFNASVLPNLSTFIILLPVSIIEIPFSWLYYIPVVLCFAPSFPFAIVGAIVGLYALYLKFVAFKEVHEFGTLQSIATIFVPIIVLVIIAILLVVLFWATGLIS